MTERNGIYERIDGSQYRNIYVVGDLHGCFNRLENQLSELRFDKDRDLLVSVGDLIDRGPQNVECLALIGNPWFAAVQGNHERMAIEALFGKDDGRLWYGNGGQWFWNLDYDQKVIAEDLIREASKLPFVIEIDIAGQKHVVCHADYPSDSYEYGKAIDVFDAVWRRDRIEMLTQGGSQKPIEGADAFYFGHTPLQHKWSPLNLNYIDTGAVFGGLLTIVKIQGGDNG